MWEVNDGSGSCGIHNTPDGYEFEPQIGEVYNITGIVTSTFNEWKVDLRIPSDVETGADITAPFITTHSCYQIVDNYYVYLYFNEPINQSLINTDNFLITNASITNVSADMFDPTKVTLTLDNILNPTMGLIILEMADLNGNSGSNLTYSIDCSNEFWVESIDEVQNKYTLFPNPNNGTFTIELSELQNTVSIYNLTGKKIYSGELPQGRHKMHLSQTGLYYLKVNHHQFPLIIHN